MLLKGTCDRCVYRKPEWHIVKVKAQLKMMPDLYCGICDIFKRPDGYCDMFEEG